MLVEVNCESDFVARTEDFKELVHDIAMHIAAAIRSSSARKTLHRRPSSARKTFIAPRPPDGQARRHDRKIVAGKMEKFYEEVCLLEQPFIKDQTITSRSSSPPRSASSAKISRSAALLGSRWAMPARPSRSRTKRGSEPAASSIRRLLSSSESMGGATAPPFSFDASLARPSRHSRRIVIQADSCEY